MPRLNIRLKLLIVFMSLFTVFFAGAFYWFYRFSTDRMMDELRKNLVVTASTAANMIDAEEHTNVYENGVEDDAQYIHIADQLRLVRDANPRAAAVYTAVRSSNPDDVIFVVSAEENAEDRAHLRGPYDASNAPEMMKAFDGPIADVEMGADEYGVWLSGYAPIRDAVGNSVGIVGVDMTADDVIQLQGQIRNVSILVFIIAYAVVFVAVFTLSSTLTRPLMHIIDAAQKLEYDEPFDAKQLALMESRSDELGLLAHVFGEMAVQVQAREQKLKQEVVQLRIEIDQSRREKQVDEIVDSEFFQNLKAEASTMRRRRSAGHASGDKPK
jgi:HAMP domain-containing protein